MIVAYVRVIAGTYRGRRLRTAEGLRVRPTSDRSRETLFNILARRIEGSLFLDVCAGSGAVGIEALSRGARAVTFIEQSRRACSVMESNLDALDVSNTTILNRDALSALRKLNDRGDRFDIIFFDPPYASEIYAPVLKLIGGGALLADEGIVVVEHHSKRPPAEGYGLLRVYRTVRQGESAFTFYSRAELESS